MGCQIPLPGSKLARSLIISFFYFPKKTSADSRTSGGRAANDSTGAIDLRPFAGLHVVCAPSGAVLTAYRNHDFRSLRLSAYMANSHNQAPHRYLRNEVG